MRKRNCFGTRLPRALTVPTFREQTTGYLEICVRTVGHKIIFRTEIRVFSNNDHTMMTTFWGRIGRTSAGLRWVLLLQH